MYRPPRAFYEWERNAHFLMRDVGFTARNPLFFDTILENYPYIESEGRLKVFQFRAHHHQKDGFPTDKSALRFMEHLISEISYLCNKNIVHAKWLTSEDVAYTAFKRKYFDCDNYAFGQSDVTLSNLESYNVDRAIILCDLGDWKLYGFEPEDMQRDIRYTFRSFREPLKEPQNVPTSVPEIKEMYGLTNEKISSLFHIPSRTVDSWSSGERKPNDYIIYMMHTILSK